MKSQTLLALLSTLINTTIACSNTAALYGQCGGINWTGSTECASGSQCYCQNDYYSQCLAADPGTNECSGSKKASTKLAAPKSSTATDVVTAPASSSATGPAQSSTSPTTGGGAAPLPVTGGSCGAYSGSKTGLASTTRYYDGTEGACGCGDASGWQSNSGAGLFTAAGSQNLFGGAGSTSSWCGSGCGKCFELTNMGAIAATGQGDCTGAGQKITVMVTNLCPSNGNAQWCSQPEDQYGYGAHFDIMSTNGPEGWNNPVVSYTEVACPSALSTKFKTCQCAATSRVKRGTLGGEIEFKK